VGLGDGFLGSLPVPAGYRLEVFTDPSQQYALLTNEATGDMVDVTPQIGSIDWRPVPRASAEPLRLTIQGAGTLDVELRPRFNRGY
jgi:hypothetical protein